MLQFTSSRLPIIRSYVNSAACAASRSDVWPGDRLLVAAVCSQRASEDEEAASRGGCSHECSHCVPHNDGYENTRLRWRGRKIGDSPLCPRGGEGEGVFSGDLGALGQSRQSPIFRRLCYFSRVAAQLGPPPALWRETFSTLVSTPGQASTKCRRGTPSACATGLS